MGLGCGLGFVLLDILAGRREGDLRERESEAGGEVLGGARRGRGVERHGRYRRLGGETRRRTSLLTQELRDHAISQRGSINVPTV